MKDNTPSLEQKIKYWQDQYNFYQERRKTKELTFKDIYMMNYSKVMILRNIKKLNNK